MHSPSLDYFYTKINKTIELAQSYTEIEELGFIIRSCRLKPHAYLLENYQSTTRLQTWWVDEFGNSLEITKNKQIHIIHNDLRIDTSRVISTDLYYGLTINNIATISKLVCVCVGKDEDLYQDCALITFWGLDNYLRSYLYWYGEWQQVSPLLLGIDYLKLLAQNRGLRHFQKLEKTLSFPCLEGKSWLSYLPASQDFLATLKYYPVIWKIIQHENTSKSFS